MALNQDDVQPVQDQRREVDSSWSEEERPEQHASVPTEKSGVYVDPLAKAASGRFQTKDTVHMSLVEQGTRTKGIFKVHQGRHSSSGHWEYQLADGKGNLYKNGAWIREKQLRVESTGRR